MNRNSRLCLALALCTLCTTACKDEDYFDQQAYENLVKTTFPIDDVDPSHSWATMGSAQASVAVSGNYGETYRVRIYQNNPLRTHQGTLLASGSVVSGETLNVSFTHPLSSSTVYVAVTDRRGFNYVRPASIVASRVDATIALSGAVETQARGPRRSIEAAEVPAQSAPDVSQYLAGAVEVSTANADHNNNNGTEGHYESDYSQWQYYNEHGEWPQVWVDGTTDPDYVLKMKLTGTWNTTIGVLPSEGDAARTLYVSGTWTLPANVEQRVGGGAVIVVASGGHIVIPEGSQLNFVNHGRLIVMPGGQISGDGRLQFPNGSGRYEWNSTDAEREADRLANYDYNGGTVTIGTLNNNGGYVFNYGTLTATTLQGGAGKSCYVNHGHMTIDHSAVGSGSANTRIYNACWMECTNLLEARNLELGATSYLHAGSLKMSDSQDGTGHPCYIALAEGALLDVPGDVSLNNTSIVGPTSAGYAFVQFGKITYCNVTGGYYAEMTAGYVANNIYLSVDDPSDPDDNQTYNQWNHSPYTKLTEDCPNGYGFTAGNPQKGNGNVTVIDKGRADVVIDASTCTPGYNASDDANTGGDTGGSDDSDTTIDDTPQGIRFCFEDNFPQPGDYDFNDCVLTVTPERTDNGLRLTVSVDAAGGTKQLAGALRVVGLRRSNVTSITVSGDALPSAISFPYGLLRNDDQLVLNDVSGLVNGQELVLALFNDIHYALAPSMLIDGQPIRQFYNTLADRNNARGTTVEPATVVFDIVCNDDDLYDLFTIDNLDAFIVESHSGVEWEVHTVPFKTQQVLLPYAQNDKLTPYRDSYPWAIALPATFRYPVEWQAIGSYKSEISGGAYNTVGHSFAEWARDHTQATDWYEYPAEGLVY